ncbi:MAG TPA: glycosyltransferase family 9 protein [Candidatus Ozemobacteraceae bacterium]|nr:glycosyltransferase family 9 protein [Candidatus Ozemobacteraceae bacterium]
MTHVTSPRRILISRTDRAGDLTLTVPVFQALKTLQPECHLTAHLRTYTAPLLRGHPAVDQLIVDDPEGGLSLLALARTFRESQFDAAILVHPSMRAILAAFLAGIPLRIGRASNLWQIFLNRRAHQHRSRNEKHEYQYNLDLLNALDIAPPDIAPRLFPDPALLPAVRQALARAGLPNARPWFVHPGHGGSALNLPLDQYAKLARELVQREIPVCVTLGPGESALSQAFGQAIPDRFGFVTDLPDLSYVVALLSLGRGWVGGSTGPMHLAAAVNLPVAAFFPPLPAMTPKRWGPVTRPAQVFLPAIPQCPQHCSRCPSHPCMNTLDTLPVVEWISRHAL